MDKKTKILGLASSIFLGVVSYALSKSMYLIGRCDGELKAYTDIKEELFNSTKTEMEETTSEDN